jgi:AcrR family transcriptional regulator
MRVHREPRPQERRRRVQVLEAALQVIASRGLANTRISDISARAGMSSGHVLYYFKTKDMVLMEALRFVEDEIHETAERTLPAVPAGPKRLEALLKLNLPDGSGDPRWMLWLESWTLAPHDPHVAGLTSDLDRRWIGLLAGVVRDGVDAGALSCEDVGSFAGRFSALFDGLAVQVVTGSHGRTPQSALRACLDAAAAELGFRSGRA